VNAMFVQPVRPSGKLRRAIAVSVVVHLALLLGIAFYRSSPRFVTPFSVAMGNGDTSYRLVYFAPAGATNQLEAEEPEALLHHSLHVKATRKHKHLAQQQANVGVRQNDNNQDAKAGTAFGSLYSGSSEGHDVRPAYPIVFPDPPVARSEFPSGFQGDVVVEVSIDQFGNVIDLKLLKGIGDGVDEKVLSTLRHWRYKPATVDGSPVAEKHDVHFHYPG